MSSVIKPIKSSEFFYGSDDRKSDKNMHLPILQTGDIRMGLAKPLVDEKKLKAIRERIRGKEWYAKQAKKHRRAQEKRKQNENDNGGNPDNPT